MVHEPLWQQVWTLCQFDSIQVPCPPGLILYNENDQNHILQGRSGRERCNLGRTDLIKSPGHPLQRLANPLSQQIQICSVVVESSSTSGISHLQQNSKQLHVQRPFYGYMFFFTLTYTLSKTFQVPSASWLTCLHSSYIQTSRISLTLTSFFFLRQPKKAPTHFSVVLPIPIFLFLYKYS